MRFGGIVFTLLLSLGACSSDPEPQEPKASATPTPTVTAPAMPPQAKLDSPEGAAAFVKHYVDVFNYAAATGDVEELSRLGAACVACNGYADDFRSLAKSDRPTQAVWQVGDVLVRSENPVRVDAVVSVAQDEQGKYDLTFVLTDEAPFEMTEIVERAK